MIEQHASPFLFISYAHSDEAIVKQLKADLSDQGITTWIDRENLEPGTSDWDEAIRVAIRDARAVLFMASPNARRSRIVKDELRIADMYQRQVYPVWIAGSQWMDAIPLGLGGTQHIDARGTRYEMAVRDIVRVLRTSFSTSKPPPKVLDLDFEPRNPYKGLRAFSEQDVQDFFGRESLTSTLVDTVKEILSSQKNTVPCSRLLAVVGPSGSGKSSVVMAGLLPRLQKGALPGSHEWVYLKSMVPGAHPIEALTLTLSPCFSDKSLKVIREDLEDDSARGLHLLITQLIKESGQKLVLLVDQFEELFTLTTSEKERRQYIDLLTTAAIEPQGSAVIILTLRADFYDRPLPYLELSRLILRHQSVVLPMDIHDLRAVIEQPAALRDVQLSFEGNLAGDLLYEVQGQIGSLPLLQFTLDQLFQRRSGHQLTLQAYQELGGLKGALAKHAESTYLALTSDEHHRFARALFLRLIDPGMTEQETTRRRAALSEFFLDDPSQTLRMREVIDAFIAARLLTANEVAQITTVEVSHEALIREWKRLAVWVGEARDDIRLQKTISEDVGEWERHKKPSDRLYRGSQLKEARKWARRNMPSGNEATFLRASALNRVYSSVVVIVILFILILSVGLAGWYYLNQPPDPTRVTNLQDNGVGSLRWAIVTASSGSTITFAPDLKGTLILSHDNLSISKNLTIHGPGKTILSISSGFNGYNVSISRGITASISGLTFMNSTLLQSSFISNNGDLTLADSAITGNTTSGDGGGISNSSFLTIINSTVSNNIACNGGGISNSSFLTIINSTISNNIACKGGGINNNSEASNIGTITLTNSTISGNTVSGAGGGINSIGIITLMSSTVSNNKAGGNGGGVENEGSLVLTNSTVSNNKASGSGGGIDNRSASLVLTNSTVSSNTASVNGGGINNEPFDGSFLGNSATILFCTIYGNRAHNLGGGVASYSVSNNVINNITPLDMRYSVVAANVSDGYDAPDVAGQLRTNPDPISQDGLSAEAYGFLSVLNGNIIQNISGVVSANYSQQDVVRFGTFTNVKIDSALSGKTPQTQQLLSGSPAIDRVPLNICQAAGILTDERDRKRPDNNEQFCDVGAYEYIDS